MKGAVDDLDLVIKILEESGFKDRFYIHCDGALFGLMIPFVKKVNFRFNMFSCFFKLYQLNVCLDSSSPDVCIFIFCRHLK